jgi:hypothetical protein
MRSIENGVKYITTSYVFHCEDDWEFYDYGFIETSMDILQENEKISQVILRQYNDYSSEYVRIHADTNNKYRQITTVDNRQIYSFNPSLKKLTIQLLNIPYNDWDDEYTIQQKINELGYFAVVTTNPNGYVRHIGWNRHIDNIDSIKYRYQFPEKII